MKTVSLSVDSKNRISLTKLLDGAAISSVRAYRRADKIILEPMAEVPARELWLFQNEKALTAVQKGLSEKATEDLGSFAKYVKED
jgi:hypothetical protein